MRTHLLVERAPLAGRRVAVTRGREQAGPLLALLQSRGASAVALPTIAIAPPSDAEPVDAALRGIDRYDWIAFTSANAVSSLADRAEALGLALPATVRLAVVGPVTERAARMRFRRADLVAGAANAESLAAALVRAGARRVLFPRSDIARDALPRALRGSGATVDEIVAYRTLPGSGTAALAQRLRDGSLDAVLFMSASSVTSLSRASLPADTASAAIVCIGTDTARAALDVGLRVDAVADDPSAEGLVLALEQWFATHNGRAPGVTER